MIEGKKRGVFSLLFGVLLGCLVAPGLFAQGPDVIVGSLPNTNSYGTTGGTGIYAYSVATTSCNVGTANLAWQQNNSNHPVIAQDMFKLLDGRFTQIGNSWLKHGFCALQNGGLCTGCGGGGGCLSFLTPGCADPYGAGLNGTQSNLGPRSQVNATTGAFPYPFSAPSFSGPIARRMQVHSSDLIAGQNPGALYFISGHYVAADDSNFGNQANNASYRRVTVNQNSTFSLSVTGGTQQEQPPIQAWQDFQPTVTLVDVMADGLFIVGFDVIDNGNGTWRYEYAVYNMYSDQSAGSFFVPVPAGVTLSDIGFHDNNWHSGEPYSTAPWTVTQSPGLGITWATDDFATDPNANAIRWSQLYNFYFTADAPPQAGTGTLGLFKPGAQSSLDFGLDAPSGAFLPAVQNLACVQNDPNSSTTTISWNNGAAYDSVVITRNGGTIATLGGGMTMYTDTNPGFGLNEYTVSGVQGGIPSFGVPCSVDSAPPEVSNVSCDQPDVQFATVDLNWTNAISYDSVEIYRDGAFLASLGGTATSYTDNTAAIGFQTYEVAGVVDGVEGNRIDCTVNVAPPPALDFTMRIMNGTGSYDSGTGIGTASLSVMIEENAANANYPNPVRGFSVSAQYDDSVLTAVDVIEGAGLPPMIDFFTAEVTPGAFTLGVVIDFQNTIFVELTSSLEMAVANFSTNATNLQGNASGATTTVSFVDGLGTTQVDNLVVANFDSIIPNRVSGDVTLAAGGAIFRRGDTNNDGTVNIADGIATLAYLFTGGPATCLDALDSNDDGSPNIADAIYLLDFLFGGGPAPAAPFPGCGSDSTGDATECDSYTGAC